MIPTKRNSNLVLVQNKVEIDGMFNATVEWVEFCQVWVSIDPARGREVYRGEEKQSVVTHKIRGDYLELEGVTEEMRIVYNDTHEYDSHGIRADSLVFDILAVMPNHDLRDDTLIQANLFVHRYGDLPDDVSQ